MIPYANATLTQIAAVGSSDDFDTAASAGSARWTGSLAIYVAEEILEELTNGKINQVQRTRLEIPYVEGAEIERGDKLTYSYENATHTGTAGTFARSRLAGRVKILLEDR